MNGKPSIWENRPASAAAPRLPDIRGLETGECAVFEPGVEEPLHVAPDYAAAHLWAVNRYHLTSTQALPMYAAYKEDWERRHPAEEPPQLRPLLVQPVVNRYRKEGT